MRNDFPIAAAFIAPALLIYLLYFLLPIPMSGFFSFFKWDGISPTRDFIGLRNWGELFRDHVFWWSVRNNILLVVFSIGIQLPVGLLLGLFISSGLKGTRAFKLLYFTPMMISAVAIGITWKFIYEPNIGLINQILTVLGRPQWTQGWLGETHLSLLSVMITISWQYIPYYMVIFAAALSGIAPELREAARMDGAGDLRLLVHVLLPLLWGTIRAAIILCLTGSLRYFALIFVMTEGGPNHSSELMATYMYKQAFSSFRMGYGSTIALFMFLISFGLTILVLRLGTRRGTVHG
jgi:raffinose/stachyose/melibiose transport system permease protein